VTKSEASSDSNDTTFPRRPVEVDKYVDTFLTVVCDTSRRYILELLAIPTASEPDLPEKRSGDIARAINLSPATTSEHLKHLVTIGLVSSRREGNVVYYRLRNQTLVRAFQTLVKALDDNYALENTSRESEN
jgi:DNA-binding transcriptional ArsR family regulator